MDTPPAELIPECSIHSSPATFAQNSPFFFQILAIASILKCKKRLEMWLAVVGQSRANQELYEREAIDGAARASRSDLSHNEIRALELEYEETLSWIAKRVSLHKKNLLAAEIGLTEHDELLTRYVLDLVLEWKRKKQE